MGKEMRIIVFMDKINAEGLSLAITVKSLKFILVFFK